MKKLVPAIITGFVILRPGYLKAKGSVNFALKLFRAENQSGFILGLTDSAQTCQNAEAIMKRIRVDKLILWPRIRKELKDDM